MGWPGIWVLGLATGFFTWLLHPLRRMSHMRPWAALLAGCATASVAKMAGNLTGFFYDGDILEWPICTAAAYALVALTMWLFARR